MTTRIPKQPLRLPAVFHGALCVPGRPEVPLRLDGDRLVTDSKGVESVFPVVNGAPILIDETRSIFTISDYVRGEVTTMDLRDEAQRFDSWGKKLKRWLGQAVPGKSRSVTDFSSTAALHHVYWQLPDAKVLVVGAGDARFGAPGGGYVVYTDVALAQDTHLIADAHDIPFVDNTFDAVFAISVLEHVLDPYRVVGEMQRVLKPNGFVYAVTPFMQQVHMGPFDVTRFTHVGHRRLFRWFDEIRSGVSNGPGMAVAWAIEYWLSSWSEHRRVRNLLRTLSRFLTWPFLLLDARLAHKSGTYDCAAGFYFFGRLRSEPVSDRDIVAQYRGLNR